MLTTAVFFLVRLMPGGPFTNPKMTPEIKEVMEAYYGLDKPLLVQYVQYMGNLLRGDFGYSMTHANQSVTGLMMEAFPFSADIGIRSLVFAFSVGIVLGIIAALNRGKKLDFVCILVAIVGTSVPDFIMGGILQYFFGMKWGLFPIAQYKGIEYTILPMVALGFTTLASVSRIMRSSMLEVVNQDYVKTAKAKGLNKVEIVVKHELRNAILPIVTIMGPLVASILTGTFVIESIFAIPGMGKYYVDSISSLDYTMVLGMTVFFGILLVIANTITDIVYGLVDPRIRVS